jgi:uncharacterized membrane protein HdeD (DUF308 family)
MVVFQNYSLLPWKTVEQNVDLAVKAARAELTAGVRAEVVHHHLDMVGLLEARHKRPDQISGGMRALLIITGALSLVLGFVALRSFWDDDVVLAGWILAIFIGISFLFRGFSVLFMGIEGKGQPGRGWNIFAGIVIIIGGMIILTAPLSIVVLAWVVGIWLIVMGIFEIISSFMVRKAASA